MKVCFFAPPAYSYFNPDGKAWAGGAEIQQILVARHMVERGIDVSFIVGDFGQPDAEIIDGITLIKSFEPSKGNRKVRFLPDMLKIQRAVKIADADVYNQRSTSFFTGQLSYFTSRMGRIFTFSIGSMYNCYPDGGGLLPLPISMLYRYGIRKSDAVIAQTEEQRRILKENFGKESVLIRNGIKIPETAPPAPPTAEGTAKQKRGFEFLWVGSFRRWKRPDLFLRLAETIPEARFTIIGGEWDDRPYFEEISAESGRIPNLEYVGFVPPDEIEEYYRRSYALINTSDIEGFPNTYLHAWVHGVPTLTIGIDPDGVIENNGIGKAARSFEGLVQAVRLLCENPALRSEMSIKARRYVEREHDIRKSGDDYIRLFEDLLSRS